MPIVFQKLTSRDFQEDFTCSRSIFQELNCIPGGYRSLQEYWPPYINNTMIVIRSVRDHKICTLGY